MLKKVFNVNLLQKGIIDPTKATRQAILNSASIASVIITTGAAVVSIKDHEGKKITCICLKIALYNHFYFSKKLINPKDLYENFFSVN